MDNVLTTANIYDYAGVQVERFKPGSTIVETVIKFEKEAIINLSVASNIENHIKAANESRALHPLVLYHFIVRFLKNDSEPSIMREIHHSTSKFPCYL